MRPLITASSIGFCYLLHMSRPLGNLSNPRAQAQHYSGWCEDLDARVAQHLAGEGSKITRAAIAAGIEISLVATWRAPLSFEKYLKRRKDAPRLCPICCRARGRRVRVIEPVEQLAFDFDAGDFEAEPAPPRLPMDSYEFLAMRRAHDARIVPRELADDWDDGLV